MQSDRPAPTVARESGFTEVGAWEDIGGGWRPLHGSFRDLGYSVEWHDFKTTKDLDWSGSFHPGGVEICLNLAGRGEVRAGSRQLEFSPLTVGFYLQGECGAVASDTNSSLSSIPATSWRVTSLQKNRGCILACEVCSRNGDPPRYRKPHA